MKSYFKNRLNKAGISTLNCPHLLHAYSFINLCDLRILKDVFDTFEYSFILYFQLLLSTLKCKKAILASEYTQIDSNFKSEEYTGFSLLVIVVKECTIHTPFLICHSWKLRHPRKKYAF